MLRINTMMINRKIFLGSSKWLKRHFKDRYVQQTKERKLRSRSWFKLEEIDCFDRIFYSGMNVIDLGSSPGGWSLYARNKIGSVGRVFSCDILPMDYIVGVDFLQENCFNFKISNMFQRWIKHYKVQVVLSDMSPNITGISIIDVSQSIHLGNLALDICHNVLISGGSFLVKIFQGIGFDEYLCNLHSFFNIIKIRKPVSSRSCSREVYILAKEYMKFN